MHGVLYSMDEFTKLVSILFVLCFYLWNHLSTLPKDDVQFHYNVIHFLHCMHVQKVDKVVGGNTIGLFGKVVYPRWLSTYRTPPLNYTNLQKLYLFLMYQQIYCSKSKIFDQCYPFYSGRGNWAWSQWSWSGTHYI